VSIRIPVSSNAEIGVCRRAMKLLAREIGFNDMALNELDVVTMELATNLAVHKTIKGEIILAEISNHLGRGIEIAALDQGPGISDVKRALKDHYSTNGSMGCGLGAVQRQMDEFDIYSRLQPRRSYDLYHKHEFYGTIIITRKWMVKQQRSGPFIYSSYSRPLPGETANGDAFLISEEHNGLFIAVADGLGHGVEAEKASKRAIEYIFANRLMPFEYLIRELNPKLHQTRGVALTLVRIDLSNQKLIHTGIGNVEARVYPRGESHLIPHEGILGGRLLKKPKINKILWPKNGTLIVFTDGISGRWDLDEIPGLLDRHVSILTHLLIQKHARPKDDATIVVVKAVV